MADSSRHSTPADLRVAIVASDPLARAGLATLLSEQPGCRVTEQMAPEPGLEAALDLSLPEVVVWDMGWEPSGALGVLANLREGLPPIVALVPNEGAAPAARAAGARGLLLRDVEVERLLAALHAAAEGLLVLDPSLSPSLPEAMDRETPPLEDLTPREVEVLQLLAEGLSNRAIALQLRISEHTVKFHINSIFGKLGVQSRTEAAVRAARLGLILL